MRALLREKYCGSHCESHCESFGSRQPSHDTVLAKKKTMNVLLISCVCLLLVVFWLFLISSLTCDRGAKGTNVGIHISSVL